jgi:two-component system OmpR family sensor kinase
MGSASPITSKRIFEAILPGQQERSRGMGGAVLGLAITQSTVEQHHGNISVESTPGSGSIFRVELPLAATNVKHEISVRQPAL